MSTAITADEIATIRSTVVETVEAHTVECVPSFYAVTGSHLYGTATSRSDIDIRGFHCADGTQYLLFDQPDSHYSVTRPVPELDAEIDVTSYELRKFGQLFEASDFTAVELLYAETEVLNMVPDQIDTLRSLLEDVLPAEVSKRYGGMATSLYQRDIEGQRPDTPAELKPYVYSLRGALAAQYVATTETIEPNLSVLAESVLSPSDASLVHELFEYTRVAEAPLTNTTLVNEITSLIETQLQRLPETVFTDRERLEYRNELADWMLAVRRTTETR